MVRKNMKELVCKSVRLLAVIGLFCTIGIASAQKAQPGADDLIAGVRKGMTAAPDRKLQGTLYKERSRLPKVPFVMTTSGDLVSLQYNVNGQWQRFDLKFKASALDISVEQSGKMVELADKDYAQGIGGTDISCEDLSMRFLYWKNGKILPEDSNSVVKGRNCWVVELKNPKPSVGHYAWVRVWIGKDDGALWQIDGYDKRGELSKRFILNSVAKLDDGSWFLQEMKLEVRDPEKPTRVIGISKINVNR